MIPSEWRGTNILDWELCEGHSEESLLEDMGIPRAWYYPGTHIYRSVRVCASEVYASTHAAMLLPCSSRAAL